MRDIVIGKLVDRTIDDDYAELSERLFGEGNSFNSSEVRKRMYGMKAIIDAIERDRESRIQDSDLLSEISMARLDLQKEVLTNCKVFLSLLDIALEQGYVDIRRCEYWTGLTTDIKNLAASWRKKDAERFRYLLPNQQPQAPRR